MRGASEVLQKRGGRGDRKSLSHAERGGGGVAAGTSPHPQGRQAVTAHAHWVRF